MLIPTDISREIVGTPEHLLLQADATVHPAVLESLAGQAACVYIDPPFMTGNSFKRTRPYGAVGWQKGTPRVEVEGFRDRFPSPEAYMGFLRALAEEARMLLRPDGVFYLHLDWHGAALARLVCDELFGAKNLLNEIIWTYQSGGRSDRHYSRKHDVILFYAMGPGYRFDITRVPLAQEHVKEKRNHMRVEVDEDGKAYRTINSGGKTYRYPVDAPVYPSDVWTDISHLQQRDPERGGYPTQKPLALLDRLLKPVTAPGDLVIDLACGSGTTLAAAQRLDLRSVGVDTDASALHIAAARLMRGYELRTETDDAAGELAIRTDGYNGAFELLGLRADDAPADPDPLAAIEQVRVGELRGDALYAGESFCRTRLTPDLPHAFPLPDTGTPGVSITDCFGRRRIWRVER